MTFTIKPRPRKDGFSLESESISYAMWYGEARNAVEYAMHRAGSERATIQILDEAGVVIQTIEHDPASR